jgi:hypothetical protein
MPTLTEERQAQERLDEEARKVRRAKKNVPPPAEAPSGQGTFQQILPRSPNPKDPSLRHKGSAGQKIQSFGRQGNSPSKFSDQE